MALTAGTKLGPYEVLGELGAGGMGEVYRARDTRLDRTVAIKILPEHLSSDPGRRARFEREARTISGLSHPNICALFDIGDQDGIHYVVLEYLEGRTLADRLAKGPLPVSEVLRVGADIASALEAAHRHGIVHRDLKPANVMLTKTGAKLLDFGLAKPSAALAPAAAGDAPTLSKSLTEEGVIVGTFRYMAPEQLEGKDADGRTDIFALGALLYEMATGRSAFSGASRASVIAAIMSSDPAPISELQPLFPPALDRMVQTCLAKDPDERWQTAHDVRLQLEWIRDSGSQAGVPRAKGQRRITRERIAWASATFLLLAVATTFVMRSVQPSAQRQPQIMFTVEPPPGYLPVPDAITALSPDGAQIAYAVTDAKGKKSLWVRALDSLAPRRLEGSESIGDYYSFTWTPDGRAVVALVNGKLLRLSATGGANEVLCESFDAFPSTINRDGTILAWTAPPTKIISVSPIDCTLRDQSPSDAPGTYVGYGYPHFLPDGNHFLFAAIRKDKHHEVLLGSLDGSKSRVLVRNGSDPKYVSDGYILFSRDGYLMAQSFDAKSKATSGEPFLAYPNQLRFYAAFGWAAFDASRNGSITAQEQSLPLMLLRWYDRSGQVLKTLGEPEYAIAPRLDAQETHVLVSLFNPRTHAGDIWSLDLEHGTRRRESFHDRPGDGWAIWTARGERIVYSVLLSTHAEMFIKNAGSSDDGQMIRTGLDGAKIISDVSPDGNSILYLYQTNTGTETAIYGQSLIDGKPFLIGPAPGDELPRLSPDGGWVAVPSNASGSAEIVVRPFVPGAAGGTQVSFGGGHDPRWSRDGKELFYRTNDWHVVAVPVVDLKQHRFGKPVTLFRLPEGAEYDVVKGKRFLVNEPAGPATAPLFVIENWRPEPAKSE
jgi:serine/threonine protein kinase/Tol biopolymer transport system component